MTNREKFKKVFGFDLPDPTCVCDEYDYGSCIKICPDKKIDCDHWQNAEYKDPLVIPSPTEARNLTDKCKTCDARYKNNLYDCVVNCDEPFEILGAVEKERNNIGK